jgi:hypothetical protein
MVFEAREMRSQKAKTKYGHMAPVGQYLMTDRNAEIALARSAAPESISRGATALVLGRHGYETAVEGQNGFVCVVERGWMSPADAPEFWKPKTGGRTEHLPGYVGTFHRERGQHQHLLFSKWKRETMRRGSIMSARAIQDQKAIAPETFVQQAVRGNAIVPAGGHQGNTAIEMRPDCVLHNAEEKQLGKLLDGAFARGMQPSSLEARSNQRSNLCRLYLR